MKEIIVFSTPLGNMRLETETGAVTALRFTDEPVFGEENEAVRRIREYFSGGRKEFELELAPAGTPFQRRVWAEILKIPYGQMRTYGQIAEAVGKPSAARAVGMACGRNPIWIAVPCHRVVGFGGKLTGYAGGLDKKKYLLDLEQKKV